MSSYVTSGTSGVSSCSTSSRTMRSKAMPERASTTRESPGRRFPWRRGPASSRRFSAPPSVATSTRSGPTSSRTETTCPLRGKSSAATAIIVSSRRTHCPYERSVTSSFGVTATRMCLPPVTTSIWREAGNARTNVARVWGGRDTSASSPCRRISSVRAVVSAVVRRPFFSSNEIRRRSSAWRSSTSLISRCLTSLRRPRVGLRDDVTADLAHLLLRVHALTDLLQ